MLIEIHMLQNHSPANLNRDDLGAPKTAMFGGTLRARISSQCLKRSIRWSPLFRTALEGHIGTRTVSFPEFVREALKNSGLGADENEKIVAACTQIAKAEKNQSKEGSVEDDAGARTPQLIFLCPNEAKEFVARLTKLRAEMPADYQLFLKAQQPPADTEDEAPKRKPRKGKGPSRKFWEELRKSYGHNGVDVALFGRMTTSDAFENVEATMEVAHAISTNEVVPEVDYFTAVDDMPGRAGAAYLKEGQFNSATFYKYFSLDWAALVKELGDEPLAAKAVAAFIEAAACTTPTGKRNSFANSNLPDGIMVEVKKKLIPTNYANAFLVPARPYSDNAGHHDIMADSIRRLDQYVKSVADGYRIDSQRRWFTTRKDVSFVAAEPVATVPALIAWTMETISAKGV